jgi:hypothetical protein
MTKLLSLLGDAPTMYCSWLRAQHAWSLPAAPCFAMRVAMNATFAVPRSVPQSA